MSNDKKVEDRYTRVFGAYDIRGIVGDDLDSATIIAIARAFGDYLCPKEPGSFLIGPGGKMLATTGTLVNDGTTMLYRALQHECAGCALKPRCCPSTPARKVPRSIHEGARDMARQIAKSWEGGTSRRLRKKVEMLFAHLKRILKLDRLRLRGPTGAHDEFLLAATAQNLRKLAKLVPTPTLKPA